MYKLSRTEGLVTLSRVELFYCSSVWSGTSKFNMSKTSTSSQLCSPFVTGEEFV